MKFSANFDVRHLPAIRQMQLLNYFIKLELKARSKSKQSDRPHKQLVSLNSVQHFSILFSTLSRNLVHDLGIIEEREFSSSTRDILKNLKQLFVMICNQSSLSMLSFPDNTTCLGEPSSGPMTSPLDIVLGVVNTTLGNIARNRILNYRLESLNEDVKRSRIEIRSTSQQVLQYSEEHSNDSSDRAEKLQREKLERLQYTNKILRSTAENLKEQLDNRKKSPTALEMTELMDRYKSLVTKKAQLTKKLTEISGNNALVPNMTLSREILQQRSQYLHTLMNQITALEMGKLFGSDDSQ